MEQPIGKGEELEAGIFEALFRYRPREDTTSKENFLTEALVYVLKRNPAARRTWVALLTGGKVDVGNKKVTFTTQARAEGNGDSIPDVVVSGRDANTKLFRLIVEHKWDARVDVRQLKRYSKLVGKTNEFLGLIYANSRDDGLVKKLSLNCPFVSCRWDRLYAELKASAANEVFLSELLTFMEAVALSPGVPISKKDLVDCARGKKQAKRGSALRAQFMRYCEKLKNEYQWGAIPSALRAWTTTRDSLGRCALCLGGDDWGPEMSLGFYYNTSEHNIALAAPSRGVDIALRFLAPSRKNKEISNELSILARAADAIEKSSHTVVNLRDDAEVGNKHTILMVHRPAWDVIGKANTEEEQVKAIHDQFTKWLIAIFADKEVLGALRSIKGYDY